MLRILAPTCLASSRLPWVSRKVQLLKLSTYAWGNGDYGQLGLPTNQLKDEIDTFGQNSPVPQRIPQFSTASPSQVAISCSHSAFIRSDGMLLTCGHGKEGQLGLGDTLDRCEPTTVPSLPPLSSVACGARHTLAQSRDGLVFAFGSNASGQLGVGQLQPDGEGKFRKLTGVPQLVSRLAEDGRRIVNVSAGDHVSAAVSDSGRVFTWGASESGALGHARVPVLSALASLVMPRDTAEGHPRLVRGLADHKITTSVCGRRHVVVLTEDGRAFAWGSGRHYLLGTESEQDEFEPVPVMTGLGAIKKVAVGTTHTLILTRGGNVYAMGENDHGCLGIGTTSPFEIAKTPVFVKEVSPAKDIAAGWYVSAAVRQDGSVCTWGCASAGALGLDGDQDCASPQILGLTAARVVMSSGGTSVIATK